MATETHKSLLNPRKGADMATETNRKEEKSRKGADMATESNKKTGKCRMNTLTDREWDGWFRKVLCRSTGCEVGMDPWAVVEVALFDSDLLRKLGLPAEFGDMTETQLNSLHEPIVKQLERWAAKVYYRPRIDRDGYIHGVDVRPEYYDNLPLFGCYGREWGGSIQHIDDIYACLHSATQERSSIPKLVEHELLESRLVIRRYPSLETHPNLPKDLVTKLKLLLARYRVVLVDTDSVEVQVSDSSYTLPEERDAAMFAIARTVGCHIVADVVARYPVLFLLKPEEARELIAVVGRLPEAK